LDIKHVAIDGKTLRGSGPNSVRCTWSAPGPPPSVCRSAKSPSMQNPTKLRPFPRCSNCWT
jgi:hypothetical protein